MGCAPSKTSNQGVVDSQFRPQARPDDKDKLISSPAKQNNNQEPDTTDYGQIPSAEDPVSEPQTPKKDAKSPKKVKESPVKSPSTTQNQKPARFRPKSAGIPFSEPKNLQLTYEKASQLEAKDAAEMWAIVNRTSDKESIQIEPTKNRKGWRTIRVFVSSTFKDFHPEREVLVKEVRTFMFCYKVVHRYEDCEIYVIPPTSFSPITTFIAASLFMQVFFCLARIILGFAKFEDSFKSVRGR